MKLDADVIVAGAGPAGSAAAAVLGERGLRVLLLDKSDFPREKTCGDGITYKCLEPLERLGLLSKFREKAVLETTGYSLFFSDGTELTVRKPPEDGAKSIFIVKRFDFDELILEAARRSPSVEFRPRARAKELIFEGGTVVGVRLAEGGGDLRARAVIDATGATSSLAVEVGAGNRDPRTCALAIRGYYEGVEGLSDVIELYFDDKVLPGYYWVFPTSKTTANVGCGTFQHIVEERQLDLRKLQNDFIAEHPIARKKLGKATLCGELKGGKIPLALGEYRRTRVRDGLVLVGDAGSFVNPITAEGISYALRTGIMAAEAIAAALARSGGTQPLSAAALAPYDAAWLEAFESQFQKGIFLTTGLPKEAFVHYMTHSFLGNPIVARAEKDLGLQYELMVKLKVLMKAV